MERINVISRHLSVCQSCEVEAAPTSSKGAPMFGLGPDDIVVVQALRTPIGKSKKGVFKDTFGDDLLAAAMSAVLRSTSVKPHDLGDVCIGNCGDPMGAFSARAAQAYSKQSRLLKLSDAGLLCLQSCLYEIKDLREFNEIDSYADDLLSTAMNGVLNSVNIKPADIGDICIGNVNDSKSSLTSRIAQFFSGIPETVPVSSVNRQCGSGLQAFMNIAGGIKNKSYSLGMAGGVEMMTKQGMGSNEFDLNPKVMDFELAKNSLIPMGITSENVAARFGISREKQDRFSMESHKKAARATKEGHFKAEIVPVTVEVTDKNGDSHKITVTQDEGIRGNTNMEVLTKLRPAFQKGGTTTAGNSSQTSDGAAAVLVASRREAEARNLPILGTLRAFAVKGCPPDIMGIGPAVAIPEALRMAGLTNDDIDIFEINEAFASQAVYCVEKLGIPAQKVNPKGGAVALGHPLGCTGARMIATLLHELKRRGKRSLGVVSMCMGTGMGAAAVFEYSP